MDDNGARAVSTLLLDHAKKWWGISIALQLIAFAVGVIATSAGFGAKTAAFAVVAFTVASYLCQLRSSTWNGRGESLRRRLDMRDAYGWAIPNVEWSDLLVMLAPKDREKTKAVHQEDYFASSQHPGPRRAIEALMESSWYSKHLSRLAGHISLAVIVLLVGFSIATMAISINTLKDFDLMSNIARVVTSALMLMFSMDMISLTLRYYEFSSQSGEAERQANEQIASADKDIVPSLKLWQDYHVSRAVAPPIPTWLWRWKRDSLNQIWETCRK